MYIAICDDCSLDREIIIDLLKNYFRYQSIEYAISDYERGSDLIYDIEDGKLFNLIFLDIYMRDELGIDVARKLRDINYKGDIVFLTATSDFAVDSYEVEAKGYLLKPHNYEKICNIMNKITQNIEIRAYNIHQRNGFIRIPFNDILYVESNNSKCIMHSLDGEDYVIYKRLNEIEDELNDSRFLRCHQSYLVNMNYIQKADRQFELTNGDIVCIRQRNLKAIKQEYFNYIGNKTQE